MLIFLATPSAALSAAPSMGGNDSTIAARLFPRQGLYEPHLHRAEMHQPLTSDTPELDPFAASALENPYPVYRQLHERGSICWNPRLQYWLIANYEACQQALSDNRFCKDYRNVETGPAESAGYDEEPASLPGATTSALRSRWFLLQDPPNHTRLRDLVSDAFLLRNQDLERAIPCRLDELMEQAESSTEIDFMDAIATPLAASILFHVLGLEGFDQRLYLRWAHRLVVCADPFAPATAYEAADAETIDLLDGLRRHLRQQDSTEPSVVGNLLTAREEGRLGDDELLATLTLLMFGGVDTTANLLGNGLHALLTHPDQWDLLVERPDLTSSAVEELLRWDSPLQLLTRVARTNVSLAGHPIAAGQWLGILVGAANRDPRRFPEPDRLDLTRPPMTHLAFGRGIHTCLALSMARLEARIVFATLARRWPGIRLGSAPRRRPTAVFRGFSKLPVRLNRGAQ